MVPTCFGLRPSSGSLQLSLAKVMQILNHSVRLRPYLLCGVVAAATTPHNKLRRNLTECFNIYIYLQPGSVASSLMMGVDRNMQELSNFDVNFDQSSNKCASVGECTVSLSVLFGEGSKKCHKVYVAFRTTPFMASPF